MSADLQLVRSTVADVLEISPDRLQSDVIFEELTDYDSIKMLTLMVALDDLGISLSQQDVSRLRTFGDVESLARARLGS